MVTYCLDTGVVIAFLKEHPQVVEKLRSIERTSILCITPIVLCELYKGVYKSSNTTYELSLITRLLPTFSMLDFTEEACRIFGKDFVTLQREGKMTDDFDVMIAALAKAHGATLVTRNKKHFEHIQGLNVEEW